MHPIALRIFLIILLSLNIKQMKLNSLKLNIIWQKCGKTVFIYNCGIFL